MKRLFVLVVCVGVVVSMLVLATKSNAVSAALAIVTCATTAPCTEGNNTGTGSGLLGQSKSSHGVIGNTLFNSTGPSNGESAVFGQDLSTTGVFNMGVQGISTRGYGVRGKSQANDGVRGDSTSGFGVRGVSPQNIGVRGESASGFGVSGVSTNVAVLGETTNGFGVFGDGSTSGSTGVAGTGATLGVFAVGETGMESVGNSGDALAATSMNGDGVVTITEGTSHWGLIAQSPKGGGANISALTRGADITGNTIGVAARSNMFPLVVTDSAGNNLMWVDGSGNIHFKGELLNFGSSSAAATSMARATTPATEEAGSARLSFGSANVYFSSSFARSIDPRHGYQVFLTPGGDTRGLYVAAKYAGGFVVREVQGGRGSFGFDYHVYAQGAPGVASGRALTAPSAPVLPLQLHAPPRVTLPRPGRP